MSRITLRQLKYFDALAREQHFGRAARACAISQPALSMQVRELEQILGITLIERGPKQVQLTRFGERVAERAVGILRAVDDLEAIGRTAHDQFGGTLRLGMIPTIAPYLLPAVVKNLGKAYPDLAVQVREAMTARLIEELLDGRLDTAIVAL
ncbi:MAG: LysR family transcriptional regulator, partial [Pseudomonadota bacterium]